MSVQHFPRAATVLIPVDVPLYSGVTALTGQTANLSMRIICLDNTYTLDGDNTFRTSPSTPDRALAAMSDYTNDYFARFAVDTWPRGHYRSRVVHSTTQQVFNFDFTVGLVVDRRLAFSASYNSGILTLTVWIEEFGVMQFDYTELTSCQLYDQNGGAMLAGLFGTNSSPVNGIFSFHIPIALSAGTNYVFRADAHVNGPATIGDYVFPLAFGLSRP